MMINEIMSTRRLYLLGLHWEWAIPYHKHFYLGLSAAFLAAD